MAATWIRQNGTAAPNAGGFAFFLGASVPIGKTALRSYFGFNINVQAQTWQWELLQDQPVFVGLQTIRSGYGAAFPNPANSPLTNLGPPAERWVFWEAESLTARNPFKPENYRALQLFGSSGNYKTRYTESEVKNPYPDQTLNFWVSVAAPAVHTLGLTYLATCYCGVLYQLWLPQDSHGGKSIPRGSPPIRS